MLKHYLQSLAFKVGQFQPGTTLNYIDGFSGPWDAVAEGATDSSPHIALTELRNVKAALASSGKSIVPRALFVEQDATAFANLGALLHRFPDVQTESYQGAFEDHIPQAVRFAGVGPKAFAFTFIDPTGWGGYALERITPLLRVRPGEVLINFMTKDILRFIDDPRPTIAATFSELFGGDFRDQWRTLEGWERQDAIVRTYSERVRLAGAFTHVASAVVLNPNVDRTHYHLIYATRSLKGLTTFRQVEASAMKKQTELRAKVRSATRTNRRGTLDLFAPEDMETNYFDELVTRYQGQAFDRLRAELTTRGDLSYEDALAVALQSPMTAEADVKHWIDERRSAGDLVVVGLQGKQRVPKIGDGHRLRWLR